MAWRKRAGKPENRSNLCELVLIHVKTHPNVKLSSIEEAVEAPRVEVAKAIERLRQQGKLYNGSSSSKLMLQIGFSEDS